MKKAIQQDFFILDEKIDTITHPTEQTQSLGITIKKLLPISGKSQVVYVFDFRSKRLIQVNILVGHPVDADITPQQVVDSGNLLGSHFIKNKVQRRWLNGACKAQRSFGFNISRQRSKWSNGAFTFIQSATNQKKRWGNEDQPDPVVYRKTGSTGCISTQRE